MSDIQTISQGNYVLATQQEVSHDSTLSGNGTVDSPLGVNETVIYSGTYTNGTFPAITANETIWNFERIRVTLGIDQEHKGVRGTEVREWYTEDLSGTNFIVFNCTTWNGTDYNKVYPHSVAYSGTSDGLVFNPYYAGYHLQTYDGTSPGAGKSVTLTNGRFNTTAASTYEFGITRIIGINRIANS